MPCHYFMAGGTVMACLPDYICVLGLEVNLEQI